MIILAYGVPGSGKSTLLHDLVKAHAESHRLFCVDHEQGWGPGGIHWRGKDPKDLFVVDGQENADALFDLEEDEWPSTGVWVFQRVEPDTVGELVNHVGDAVFVDDEIDILARKKGWDNGPLRTIVHQGRHSENAWGVIGANHIIGACRRPQNLHNDITDMADEVYVFRLRGSRTLERLLADSLIEAEQWETIRNLPTFTAWHAESQQFKSVLPIGGGQDGSDKTRQTQALPKQNE